MHLLCNNAGVQLTGATWELELREWQWLHGVNLWGVIHGIKAFVPGMIEHGGPGARRQHVVRRGAYRLPRHGGVRGSEGGGRRDLGEPPISISVPTTFPSASPCCVPGRR